MLLVTWHWNVCWSVVNVCKTQACTWYAFLYSQPYCLVELTERRFVSVSSVQKQVVDLLSDLNVRVCWKLVVLFFIFFVGEENRVKQDGVTSGSC